MEPILRFTHDILVYPGLFYLANNQNVPGTSPWDPSDVTLDDGKIGVFTTNGIIFISTFQSHLTTVSVEYITDTNSGSEIFVSPDTWNIARGFVTIAENGMGFANPDMMFPETRMQLPPGAAEVLVRRETLVDPTAFVPPSDDANPSGLERWSVQLRPAVLAD